MENKQISYELSMRNLLNKGFLTFQSDEIDLIRETLTIKEIDQESHKTIIQDTFNDIADQFDIIDQLCTNYETVTSGNNRFSNNQQADNNKAVLNTVYTKVATLAETLSDYYKKIIGDKIPTYNLNLVKSRNNAWLKVLLMEASIINAETRKGNSKYVLTTGTYQNWKEPTNGFIKPNTWRIYDVTIDDPDGEDEYCGTYKDYYYFDIDSYKQDGTVEMPQRLEAEFNKLSIPLPYDPAYPLSEGEDPISPTSLIMTTITEPEVYEQSKTKDDVAITSGHHISSSGASHGGGGGTFGDSHHKGSSGTSHSSGGGTFGDTKKSSEHKSSSGASHGGGGGTFGGSHHKGSSGTSHSGGGGTF